ncbi:MAG: YggS family pyridoxal phosphate-dependent enzyme [Eubacteriales bacterium]|nr:YggS family pyridoxal phosphate-dependent enzyme [Eubacteriales bacterium]
MSIKNNVLRVQEEIAAHANKAGRDPADIMLLAVTKFVDTARIAEALDSGITHVGENRAQECRDKIAFFRDHGCDVHFIGQFQSNKIKYIVGKVDLIQSVDRLELMQEIQQYAAARNILQNVLIQVNIGQEPQKGGVAPESLRECLIRAADMPNIHINGLMCIPPALPPEEVRPYFIKMRGLFEEAQNMALPHVSMRHLSMGMSGDYTVAVEEGATIVRVGTALFGARQ